MLFHSAATDSAPNPAKIFAGAWLVWICSNCHRLGLLEPWPKSDTSLPKWNVKTTFIILLICLYIVIVSHRLFSASTGQPRIATRKKGREQLPPIDVLPSATVVLDGGMNVAFLSALVDVRCNLCTQMNRQKMAMMTTMLRQRQDQMLTRQIVLKHQLHLFTLQTALTSASSGAPLRSRRCTISYFNVVQSARLGLFGHVTRLRSDVPANQILRICTKTRDGARPSREWRRASGRPPTTWIHQICHDTGVTATEALQLAEDRPFWRTIATAGGFGWSLRVTTTINLLVSFCYWNNNNNNNTRFI